MSLRKFEPTPEDNEAIYQTVKFINVALSIRGTPKEIGIIALMELLVLAYAEMAEESPREDAEKAFSALVDNLTKAGEMMLNQVYKNKEKPQPKLDEIVELFKGAKPNDQRPV
jgi:hypothetical protein